MLAYCSHCVCNLFTRAGNRGRRPASVKLVTLPYLTLPSVFTTTNSYTCDTLFTGAKPHNCADILKSGKRLDGVYTIYVGPGQLTVNVSCDMTTDGGGWMVCICQGFCVYVNVICNMFLLFTFDVSMSELIDSFDLVASGVFRISRGGGNPLPSFP